MCVKLKVLKKRWKETVCVSSFVTAIHSPHGHSYDCIMHLLLPICFGACLSHFTLSFFKLNVKQKSCEYQFTFLCFGLAL